MFTYKLSDNKLDYTFVREEVFMKEQGFANEFDEIDDIATHITFYNNDELIGCGRFFLEENSYIIGRISVLKPYRKQGYASLFIKTIENEIKKLSGTKVKLHAQYRVRALYEKLGYTICSSLEDDEGVPHVWMQKSLK